MRVSVRLVVNVKLDVAKAILAAATAFHLLL